MHRSLPLIDRISVASPCPASWDGMAGDDRARFCGACSKHVYNLSEMTAAEVARLVVETEGRACVRLYRRADGTVLTADCPVGAAGTPRRAGALATAAASMAVALAGCAEEQSAGGPKVNPSRAGGETMTGEVVAGGMCPPTKEELEKYKQFAEKEGQAPPRAAGK